MSKNTTDRTTLIRAHLEKKSKRELVNLLVELVQGMDEPTRQRFWTQLAPPGMATADLRYPTPEVFLAELQEFCEAVEQGEFYDEEAAASSNEDDYDYGESSDYDPDDHEGLQALRGYLHETNAYFAAGRYDIAAQAYGGLLEMIVSDSYETFGLSDLSEYLEDSQPTLVDRYFQALQESQPPDAFYQEALQFLERHDSSGNRYLEQFLARIGLQARPDLQKVLEAWADRQARLEFHVPAHGLPLQLRLLLRFYRDADRSDDCEALWVRFRRLYPVCYLPLLEAREKASDWQAVLEYGHEALPFSEASRSAYYFSFDGWPYPDQLTVRSALARAYTATGEANQAFDIYRPVLEKDLRFATYAEARRLADAISAERGQAFTAQIIEQLQRQSFQQRYLLCQVYLSEQRFTDAYHLVDDLKGYNGIEETKLVAKAHLIAALGPLPDERMGTNLHDLYTKVEHGEKNSAQFLQQVRSLPPDLHRLDAIDRVEVLYQRLMLAHIDNGRKTYATAAYYCALIGEIAAYENRLPAFANWYAHFMENYKRFRALRAEMDAKVGPVLRNRRT